MFGSDCRVALGAGMLSILLAAGASAQTPPTAGVRLLPLDRAVNFPDAAAANSISQACAQKLETLESYFAARNLPFEKELAHRGDGSGVCHVFYEPTLPGFRASRDNQKVRELYFAIDALTFLASGELPGGSLDVAKEVLPRLPRPIKVRMSVSGGFDKALWEPSARLHFGSIPLDLTIFDSGSYDSQPWAQDHMKAGSVNGEDRVLIPRRLFEGRPDNGEFYRPILDALSGERIARSKLSWEGGDLQFAASPKDSSKTILVYGGQAKAYWGAKLTPAEYGYVLRVEFGADMVLDLSQTGVHADYSVAFLPETNTALVSQIVRRSPAVARAAAFELAETFGEMPPPEIRRVSGALAQWDGEILTGALGLKDAILGTRRALEQAAPMVDVELDSLLEAYTRKNCPNDPAVCFDGSVATANMLKQDRELTRRFWSSMVADVLTKNLRPFLLGIIANQLEADAWPHEQHLERAARQLEAWGFRVVRVPYITARNDVGWPGIAYSNALVFDRRLFVPELGLGQVEERYYSKLRNDLRGEYEVIPVYARSSLLLNGGVHCVFGITRESER